MAGYHAHRLVGRQVLLVLRELRVVPFTLGEDGVRLILLRDIAHKHIEDVLFALKMAVERRLADTDRPGELGNGRGLVALRREQLQRRVEYRLSGSYFFHSCGLLECFHTDIIPTAR